MTTKARNAALKAWRTRRHLSAWERRTRRKRPARRHSRCILKSRGGVWRSLRAKPAPLLTGIIDAVAFRLDRKNADVLDLRLVQLKGGSAGISGKELARLKTAVKAVTVKIGCSMARHYRCCQTSRR